MALIHVLDKQEDVIIGTLNNEKGEYYDSLETKSLENQNTFDFRALKKFDILQTRNRLLVQDADGFFNEYIISFAEQFELGQTPVKEVKASASFIDLKKAKVIYPERLEGQTATSAAEFALQDTHDWQVGDVDHSYIRTMTISDLTNPYDFLKQVASTFDLELRFRVVVKGGHIVGRYVDLKKYTGQFGGKEITFGKDLIGIQRIEDSSRLVTALVGVGPEREDGSWLSVLVENEEALQRWGRNGQHLIEVYEPESSDQDMTEDRLRTLTQNELEKRIDAAVSYECEAVSLEHVFGRSHERIRLGQTVRIKDEGYNPPLYLEARIQEVQENPATRKVVNFKIGNFIEYRKEDLEKQVALLKKVLAQKVNAAELEALERALQGDISDINDALTDMDQYIEGAFSDGLIEKSESQAIEKYINSLNAEKTDIDNRYVTVYNDADLTGTAKSNLYSAKTGFNTAYSSLVSSINSAIADGKTTPSEKLDVDNKFTAYRNAIGTLSTRFEQAIRAIEKMKDDRVEAEAENFTRGYAETPTGAQQKANTAANTAEINAKNAVETGQVSLPTNKLTGIINTNNLDLSLAVQQMVPPRLTGGVQDFDGYFQTTNDTYSSCNILSFRHDFRYFYIKLYGFWTSFNAGLPRVRGGRCDFVITRGSDLNAPYVTDSFTNESVLDFYEQGKEYVIDLGNPDKQMKSLRVYMKGNLKESTSDPRYVVAYLRIGENFLFQHRT